MSMDQQGSPAEVVVATDYRLDPPLEGRDPGELLAAEQGVTLDLGDGRRVTLEPGDERSPGFVRVIDRLLGQGRPVAVELDQAGGIGRLYAPHVSPVTAVRPHEEGGLAVDLGFSHATHTLRTEQPGFDAMRRVLEDVAGTGRMVIVTEDDVRGILDVRLSDVGPAPPAAYERPRPVTLLERLRAWWNEFILWLNCGCWFPMSLFRSISATQAQQVFDDLAVRSCAPLTASAPCIPFLFPWDGCWGRAHEMCRLMRADGLRPCKVWITGGLRVDTANSNTCYVQWGWHVAPVLCVRDSGKWWSWFRVRSMVFDPALFTTPVTHAQWKGVQGDPGATLTESSWTIFYLWGTTTNNTWSTRLDPGFVQTNDVLDYYRTALLLHATQYGPPPYPCP
jgi:Glutaminase